MRPWWTHPLIRLLVLVPLYFGYTAVNSGTNSSPESLKEASSCRQNVAASAEKVCPLEVGEKVPQAQLRNLKGKSVQFRALLNEKPTVLIFYRGGWCPYCRLHLQDLARVEESLKKLGFQLIAVSPDRPVNLQNSIKEHELSYQLVSDSDLHLAKAFGLAFQVSDQTSEAYKEHGIDLRKASGRKHNQLPVPAVYLIDSSGQIQFQYVNPNYKVRLSGERILEAAKNLN